MKNQYPCKMMQDLMPLYYDGVCSRESAEAVKKHLSECSDCRKYYEKIGAAIPGFTSLKEDENLAKEGNLLKDSFLQKEDNSSKENKVIKENSGSKEDETSKDDEQERQKAASFLAVRKQLRKRQIFVTISSMGLFCLMAGIIVITLRHTERKISYSADLTVSMTEKGLIGRLQGDTWNSAHTKRVNVEKDGQELTYLFFCLSGNLWDAVFTNKDSYVEYTICPEDKGAEDVDCVYYYTGDYFGIEMMGYEQLQEVVKEAILLWSNDGNE